MANANLLDMEAINESRAMFKAKFPTMAGYYFEDAEGYVKSIEDAIGASNIAGIVAPAHTLKSSSRQMGAALVSDIAKEIESAAREASHSVTWFADQFKRLEDAFAQTRDAYPSEA